MAGARITLGRRLLLGFSVALLAVALFFGALEGGFRLAGYGCTPHFTRVVRDADGRRWVRENRDFTAPFFSPELVRRPQPFRLEAEKPPGTYRIFVLGSSAAMGDPEPSFSIARTLEAMLRAAYPGVRFDVVNAGITAINSHVVRLIAADCAGLQPDLFIVYEGNNEVIGPFGPAAVFGPFLRSGPALRFAIWLNGTRTGQAFANLASRFAGGGAPRDWGGMTMFLRHEIAIDDPRLADVRRHFRQNLAAIAASGRSAGAGVLLCTVVTNERDFAPFASRPRAGSGEDARRRWKVAFDAAVAAQQGGDLAAAEAHWRAALDIDDQQAEAAFQLGRLCLAQNRDRDAAAWLARALDCDALRFRTDSALNAAIRETAAAGPPGGELVDLAAAAAAQSPHGIAGDEFLYEHVHLTFLGTYRVAAQLFGRVGADLVRRGLVAAPAAEPFGYDEARVRLGFTAYEQAMIIRELLARFSAPPFTGKSDQAARLEAYRRRAAAVDRLLAREDSRAALGAAYEQALKFAPDDWVLARNYGMALVGLGAPERALPWLEKARAAIDDDSDTLFALGTALRATGETARAGEVFAELRRLEPRHPGLASAEPATGSGAAAPAPAAP